MRVVSLALVSLGLVLASAAPVAAQSKSMAKKNSSPSADAAIALRLGTLGVGLEVGKQLVPHVAARVGLNFGSLNKAGKEQSNVSYDVHFKLKAFTGLVDLYPGTHGGFHLTGGLITNPLSFTGNGQPTGGTFNINGNSYTAAQVGTLTATGKWPGVSPYLGLGFGSPAHRGGRIGILFDIGAAIGKAKIGLSATGTSSNLAADLEAQRAKTQKDVDKIPVYPVISFGVAYHF